MPKLKLEKYFFAWVLLCFVCGFVSPTVVFAQGLGPGGLIPCRAPYVPVVAGDTREVCRLEHLFHLIANIFNFLLSLAGLVLMLLIIVAGFRMILAQYGEHPQSDLEAAKLLLRRAIFGFVIVAAAFLIVQTILIVLGVPRGFFTGIPGFNIIQNILPPP